MIGEKNVFFFSWFFFPPLSSFFFIPQSTKCFNLNVFKIWCHSGKHKLFRAIFPLDNANVII